jgi:hypothetical protein
MKKIFIILVVIFSQSVYSQKNIFNHPFAPQKGLISKIEQPYREEVCLNGSWQFMPVKIEGNTSFDKIKNPDIPNKFTWENTPYKVPSPWNVNSFSSGGGGDFIAYPSYPKTWDNIRAGWVRRTIKVPSNWDHSIIKLHFEAVAGFTKVFVNGHHVGDNFDIFLPFSFDITQYAIPGKDIEICLWIAHGNLFNEEGKYGRRNYVSGSFWGNHIVGIWQDVYLQKYPKVYISDTYIKPNVSKNKLEIELTLENETNEKQKIIVNGNIKKWINDADNTVIGYPVPNWHLSETASISLNNQTVEINPKSIQKVLLQCTPNNLLDTWTPEHPNLYGLTIYLNNKRKIEDINYTRFGWREFKTKGTHLYLNDELTELKGDSWHFMGIPQMTRRYPYAWFTMLKDAGANAVRLHAQVYPHFYLDMADEMGICVLDETGIWASDGGPKIDSESYWEACQDHVRRMVLRDRNHPSIFGWSICNETLPVTKYVLHAPQNLVEKNIQEINKWIAIVRNVDNTRNWISGDGETQAKTNLPTIVGHYGDTNAMIEWKNQGKPWGIGETGMAYYGTPAQVANENGDRAYESQEGRMEGLASEAFRLIQMQRNLGACYSCVFNLAWYGLQPLELGLSDITRPVKSEDGIYFPPYIENIPGVQPERLGPYTSTFNPGYDSRLPLYRPWPLFDGIKAAYSKDYAAEKNKWGTKKQTKIEEPISKPRELVWISSNQSSIAKTKFENMSITFKPLNTKRNQLIVIDGSSNINDNHLVNDLRNSLKSGSSILIWNASPTITPFIESLSNERIELIKREATSYIIQNKHALLNGQTLANLYFSELTKKPVSSYIIQDWSKAESLLEPCNTDWNKWNYQGENIKTALTLRSEREKKAQGSVLAIRKINSGDLIISTLDLFPIGDAGTNIIHSFLYNMGATFNGPSKYTQQAIDKDGYLTSSLFYDVKGTQMNPKEGSELYISFWLFSPRSLKDLLAEPDMPRLDVETKNTNILQFIINDVTWADASKQSQNGNINHINGLPLEKGWNHIMIKVIYNSNIFHNRVRFVCENNNFIKQIKTVVAY